MAPASLSSNGIWVLLGFKGGLPTLRSLELLTAGRLMAEETGRSLVAILLGEGVTAVSKGLFGCGADQVVVADHPRLRGPEVEPRLETLSQLAREAMPDVILLGNTAGDQELAGRLAVRLNGSLVSDCTAFEAGVLAVHPIFGGTQLATVTPKSLPLIATVRSGVFGPPKEDPNRAGEVLQLEVSETWPGSRVMLLEVIQKATAFAALADAKVVVAGGLGLGGPAAFQLIEALASTLKGAVGCSRAVVDAGWRPYCEQIGLTGQTVSPRLYLACGIHGASQHLDGIRSSHTLIAINTDANAPLMKVADVALVADVRELLPALLDELRTANSL